MPRVSFDRKLWMEVSDARLRSLAAVPAVDCWVEVEGRQMTLAQFRAGIHPPPGPGVTLLGAPVEFIQWLDESIVRTTPGLRRRLAERTKREQKYP